MSIEMLKKKSSNDEIRVELPCWQAAYRGGGVVG